MVYRIRSSLSFKSVQDLISMVHPDKREKENKIKIIYIALHIHLLCIITTFNNLTNLTN